MFYSINHTSYTFVNYYRTSYTNTVFMLHNILTTGSNLFTKKARTDNPYVDFRVEMSIPSSFVLVCFQVSVINSWRKIIFRDRNVMTDSRKEQQVMTSGIKLACMNFAEKANITNCWMNLITLNLTLFSYKRVAD